MPPLHFRSVIGRKRTAERKRIAEMFLSRKIGQSDSYICKCGTRRKRSDISHANMISHIRTAHNDDDEILQAGEEPTKLIVDSYFINKLKIHYQGWIELIISEVQLFSCIEREGYRIQSKFYSCSVGTLMRHLRRLTTLVEQKVAALFSEKISSVFDGCTTSSVHYLACFD